MINEQQLTFLKKMYLEVTLEKLLRKLSEYKNNHLVSTELNSIIEEAIEQHDQYKAGFNK